MSTANRSSFIQSVAAGRRSTISHVQQKVEVVHPPQPFYFNLELIEGDDGSDFPIWDAPSANEQPSLKPGKAYRVLVSASMDGKPGQQAVKSQSALDLYLKATLKASGSAKDRVKVVDPRTQVEPKEVIEEEFEHEFHLNVAEELPYGELALELLYRRSKSRHKPRLAATLTVKLEGTYNPIDHQLLKTCRVSLDIKRPTQTTILHVESGASAGHFRLIGWSASNRTVRTPAIKSPEIDLATFVEQKVPPETIRNKVSHFSRRSGHVVGCIKKLLRCHKCKSWCKCEKPSLIIVDHAGLQLPWEMLELSPGHYLGALAPVVRWIAVPFFDSWRTLQVRPQQKSGTVVAYLDEQEVSHTALERDILNQLLTRYYQDTKQLRQRLKQSLTGVGMVYLGCHGIFSYKSYNNRHKMAIGSLHNPSNRLISLDLEGLPAMEGERPVLFVNACHSARLMWDDYGPFGLPEVLLAYVASGYIGTLGPVGSRYAVKIAQQILHGAGTEKNGVSPSEILRQLRAIAVKQLNENDLSSWLKFIYTFMYVYYGNPLARLRLLPANQTGEGHEQS
ncbi:MAG: CHAT domain-containing protein [Ardenticatenaceae bacterium]